MAQQNQNLPSTLEIHKFVEREDQILVPTIYVGIFGQYILILKADVDVALENSKCL